MGAPSPDGRYISFVDWASNSNLSILDLNTNEKKCITDFKNDGEQAYYSSWSHDGKKLAFFWWEMGDNEDRYNVSVVDVTGNNQKQIYTSVQVNWIELGNWSSDGQYILATLSIRDHPESQIVRISTSDGSLDILKSCDISYLGGKPWFSPDNRTVLTIYPMKKLQEIAIFTFYPLKINRTILFLSILPMIIFLVGHPKEITFCLPATEQVLLMLW